MRKLHIAVCANARRGCGAFREGAKLWVVDRNDGWGGERLYVEGIVSRNGRRVAMWVKSKAMVGFRVQRTSNQGYAWSSRVDADRWAVSMSLRAAGIRPL